MKLFLTFFLLLVGARFSFAQAQDLIRVKITSAAKIEIIGTGIVVQEEAPSAIQVSIPRQSQKIIISRERINQKTFWKVEYSDRPEVRFFSGVHLGLHGYEMRIGANYLPSKLLLHANRKIEVIGFIPMQEYLYGVLSKEMPASWPIEALKAQAVAARSYALYMKKQRAQKNYDVESTILDQVFSRIENSNIHSDLQKSIIAAVDETEGVYLMQKNGQPIKTFYHADCGGVTSSSESVFGSKGLIGGVKDASCPLNPKAKWSYQVSKETVIQKLAKFFRKPIQFFQITKIETEAQRSESSRNVRVMTADGEIKTISGNEFRELFGYQDIRSTKFHISEEGENFVFKGSGYGHGVGLCQWGARKLASIGKPFALILSHYYPELKLSVSK